MGKSSGSQTSTVTQQLSPQQQQIMQNMMSTYMPDGSVGAMPLFQPGSPSQAGTDASGSALVAPFSQLQTDAQNQTSSLASSWQPYAGAAVGAAASAPGITTPQVGLGTGWNYTGANGQMSPMSQMDGGASPFQWAGPQGQQPPSQPPTTSANPGGGMQGGTSAGTFPGYPSTQPNGAVSFSPYNTQTMAQFESPYQNLVTGTGMAELQRQDQIAQGQNADAAIKNGAFGGARDGVQRAETDRNFGQVESQFLANSLNTGFNNAQGQYNTAFNQGMGELGFNLQNEQAQNSNAINLANLYSSLGSQALNMGGTAINAENQAGQAQQQQDQNVINSQYSQLMNNNLYAGQIGQLMEGFAPGPSSTTTTSNYAGPASIWGNVGAAAAQALPAMFAMSDEDSKTKIKDVDGEDVLAAFRRLGDPKSWEYKSSVRSETGAPGGRRIGPMAQDWERAFKTPAPTLPGTSETPGGTKAIDMADMLGKLVVGLQALEHRTRGLKREAA